MESIEFCPFCGSQKPIKRSFREPHLEIPFGTSDLMPLKGGLTVKVPERDKEERIYYYECRACGRKYELLGMDIDAMLNIMRGVKPVVTNGIGSIYGKIKYEDLIRKHNIATTRWKMNFFI